MYYDTNSKNRKESMIQLLEGSYKKHMKKERLLGILLSLALMMTMMPTVGLTAYAGSEPAVKYIDADGKEKTCDNYDEVASGTTTWGEGWYVVDGNVEINGQVSFSGAIHLILCDNSKLTVTKGIYNGENGYLTIYAQSTGNSKGELDVTGSCGGVMSSICVNKDLTINGGTVRATNSNYGVQSAFGNIVINGGNVTAMGREDYGVTSYYNVTISGGTLTATAKHAGIASLNRNVTVNGGNVDACATDFNAFGGIYTNNGDVTINGGDVTSIASNTSEESKSVGVWVKNAEKSVMISEKVTSFIAAGPRGAFNSERKVKNAVAGTGWANEAGTEGKADIAISTDGQDLSKYKKVEFPEAVVPPAPNPPAPSVVPAAPVEIQDLPAVKISKPAKGKKAITVKWKKISKKKLKKSKKRIDGIEIQVSGPGVDKVVTAGKKKTSKKIKGLLPKQKYICRVRAYNYTDGVKHVSAWSKWKTAKTRK